MADDAQSIRSLNWRELFVYQSLPRVSNRDSPVQDSAWICILCLLYGGGRALSMRSGRAAITPFLTKSMNTEASIRHSRMSPSHQCATLRRERAQAYAAALEANHIAKRARGAEIVPQRLPVERAMAFDADGDRPRRHEDHHQGQSQPRSRGLQPTPIAIPHRHGRERHAQNSQDHRSLDEDAEAIATHPASTIPSPGGGRVGSRAAR